MDKKFILQYLKMSHLDNNEGLIELAETVGLETMKLIMEKCETLQVRFPLISNQKKLIIEAIKSNPNMSYRELRKKLGIPQERLRKYIEEIKREANNNGKQRA